jgi:hypothetical protein
MRRLISAKGIAVGQRNTARYCQLLYRMKSMTHSHNASFFVSVGGGAADLFLGI